MSEKNLLTEDLIFEALSDKGIAGPGSLDIEDAMKIVLGIMVLHLNRAGKVIVMYTITLKQQLMDTKYG